MDSGSPWKMGYVESFIGKHGEILPNSGLFDTLLEARGLKDRWRRSIKGMDLTVLR
jgi:hypothetical protein